MYEFFLESTTSTISSLTSSSSTKLTLKERHERFYRWHTRESGIKEIAIYSKRMKVEAVELNLVPSHIKNSFASISTGSKRRKTSPSMSIVSILQQKMTELRNKQVNDALSIPLAKKCNTSIKSANAYVEKLSSCMREDQPALQEMKMLVKEHRREIFAVKKLPEGIKPEDTYASATKLATRRAFGKDCISRSYSVEKSLWHLSVRIWKNGYLDENDANNLAEVFGEVGEIVKKKVKNYKKIDFSALQILPLDWDIEDEDPEMEKRIQRQKTILQDACLIHYDMNLEAVQRFCGGRFTGEHRRTLQMLRTMSHIVPDDIYLPFAATFIDGVPNCFYGDVENSELEENLKTDNLPAVV